MTHSILDLLRNAVVHYGYWAVGVALLLENAGVPVPGETILLLASFLAFSEHELQLPWIILVATIAATLGDNLGFALGYYGGRPLLVRYQSIFRIEDKTLARGENLFARYGAVTVFLLSSSSVCGSSRVRWLVYCECPGGNLWFTTFWALRCGLR